MELCKAHGCLCLGTHKRLCRYHVEVDAKQWPFVTEQLKKNERLLKAIKWSMTDGRYKDNETARKTLTRLAGEYPDLVPLADDCSMTWAYRAIAWLTRAVRPVKYGDMVDKFSKAVDKSNYPVRGV